MIPSPRALAAAALTGLFAAGCSSKPPAQVAVPAPTATPTVVRLEPTPAPASASSRAAGDSLPTSVEEINRRGYLKDTFFDFDRYELTQADRTALAADAAWLKAHPSVDAKLEGHCDERGTEAYNMALGERRAAAAKEYLATLGVDPSRLTTLSYGKERPFATAHDEAAWAENRRAHFVVTSR